MSPDEDSGGGWLRDARFRRATTAAVLFTLLLALLFGCACAIGSIFVARSYVSQGEVDPRVCNRVVWERESSGEGLRYGDDGIRNL
jgi:hypothetical protein